MAEAFFQATAWTMDTPKPYGAFHLVLTVLGVSLSIFLFRKEKPDRIPFFFYAAYF